MKRKLKKIIFVLLLLSICTLFGCAAMDIDVASYQYDPKGKTLIYSSDDVLLSEVYDENRTYMDIEDVPQDFINALLAVEDRTFYTHHGISIKGILRAMLSNIASGDVYGEGASTITQQVVKKLFLTDEKSYVRKINEIILAIKMENVFSKDEILEIYVNQMYLGAGTYGVQEASQAYFGKDAKDMNIAECTLIAGLFQAPSAYCPFDNYDGAIERQHIVIDAMVDAGYITEEKAEEIKKMKITLSDDTEGVSGKTKENCNAFVDCVIDEYYEKFIPVLEEKYSMDYESAKLLAQKYLNYDGITIYTTLDYDAQKTAVSSLNNALKRYAISKKATGSVVSIDYTTGKIRAYYGGNTQIDMANSPRQPGSSIKPLYYSKAIDDGLITARTMINDTLTSWGKYTPKNYEGGYWGWITIRNALVFSRNIPAVKVFDEYGVDNSISAIQSYGITTIVDSDYNLASALGGLTYGVKPSEMASAYGAIANDGILTESYCIERIVDQNGMELYNVEDTSLTQTKVIEKSTADTMDGILRDVVSYGTGTSAYVYGYHAAGKTGTTEDKKDLWFVGYCGGLSTAVWIGNLDMEVIGGSSAYSAYVFGKYMNAIVDNGTLSRLNENADEENESNNDMISITIASSSALDKGKVYFGEDEVETIWISQSEYSFYEDAIVEEATIDSSSGKLFVEGKCPEEYKKTVYFLKDYVPTQECTRSHYLDKIFKNNGKKNN